jgi:molybdopterin molybdotransferase
MGKEGDKIMKKNLIGYREALQITLENIVPLKSEIVPLTECTDRVAARDLHALVDSPSVDASLKDGYAIRSEEIDSATSGNPVHLKLNGMAAAGLPCDHFVEEGSAVRILTGAKIPAGANAVVSEEFTRSDDGHVTVMNFAERHRNILAKGSDVAFDQRMCARGERLVPGRVGILAAAGHSEIPVYRRPEVAIIATGDEVVVPGRPLPEGKLYASNMATLNAWCRRYGMETAMAVVSDKPEAILEKLEQAMVNQDAILTSGGAWTGDRDFVAHMLEHLGWKMYFHRIRIGPGKAVGFGTLNGKPIFILPGGPPSNLLAFLQIALPGLLKLSGYGSPTLPTVQVKLEETITVRDIDWTQFIFGRFKDGNRHTIFQPLKLKSRLQSMAMAEGVLAVPEGLMEISAGLTVPALFLA